MTGATRQENRHRHERHAPIRAQNAAADGRAVRRAGFARAGSRRRHNEGHGRRLTAAFEALEAFPALAESRNRLLRVVGRGARRRRLTSSPRSSPTSRWSSPSCVSPTRSQGRTRGKVETVVEGGRAAARPQAVQALASRAAHLRLLRAHAPSGTPRPSASACTRVATQRAADRLARRDRLRATATA